MERRLSAGLGLGAAVGVALGLVVPLPSASAPEPRVPAPAAPTSDLTRGRCPSAPPSLEAEIDEAWQALEAADTRLQELHAGIEGLIGVRPGFDLVPDELRPDRVEDTVLEWLDPEAAELEWVDCSEAPCVAVLSLSASDLEAFRAAADPLRDGLGTGYPWEAFGIGDAWYVTVPLGPATDDPALHHRVDLREELIINELHDLRPR
jgi:hypothetical protein